MRVTLRFFGELRRFAPDGAREVTLELPAGATVADLLEAAGVPLDEVWLLALDGRQAGPEAPLHEGARVEVHPLLAGG